MDSDSVQLIGGPCGQHGPYTFYKAFKYIKDGIKRIMTLSEFFFVKLWMDSDLVCIGELQLLWIDKNSEQVLASLRLYFLPENTPEGRMDHGEDEVLAISEKVVLRVEDLITWITVDAEWTWGRLGKFSMKDNINDDDDNHLITFSESSLDFSDVEKERKALISINSGKGPSVIILSYPRYCRYRSVMKRLEGVEDEFLKHKLVNALGGFGVPACHTRILFCKDTFDYPELEGHELLCNHLAPKLKGRPRGKRKKRSVSPGSESNESECSISNVASTSHYNLPSTSTYNPANSSLSKIANEDCINGYRKDSASISTRRSARCLDGTEGKVFLKKLTLFMKSKHTPIGRIPSLGYRELDLHTFFTKVQKLGGYDVVTSNRLWKSIFDDLGGNHGSTSAATVMRRHYERFLLPYERYVKGEEYKLLPGFSERRRLKSKINRNSVSDAETSESTSGSDNSSSIPTLISTQLENSETTENKDNPEKMKTLSLRSIRVKPERLREPLKSKTEASVPEAPPETTDVPLKSEKIEEKEEVVEDKPNLQLPESKDNEPTTMAVAPIQKVPTEETLSPIESKEIPIVDIKEEKDKEVEVIEIPANNTEASYKDVIELNSTDAYKSVTVSSENSSAGGETVITEVKKQKLDILKQGGLEVTPVRNVAGGIRKEPRPSVIQTATTHRAEIIPNDVKMDDKQQMPPPSQLATLTKRSMQMQATIPSIPPPIAPKAPSMRANLPFSYGSRSPPKVVQSKSIYSPSGETIYGDPKDIFRPTIQNIQAPKFVEHARQTGGGILDLTVKSPQKASTQIPHYMQNGHLVIPSPYPLLDHKKVGSNLEITLVGANSNNKANHVNNHYMNNSSKYVPRQRSTYTPTSTSNSHDQHKVPRKRSNTENYSSAKLTKMEDRIRNTIYSTQMYPPREMKKPDYEPTVSKQYKMEPPNAAKAPQIPHPAASTMKHPYVPPPAMFNMSNYINSLPKGVPPFMPMDPSLYYLQSMYNPLNLPPMPLMSSPDSLQLYTEILAQSSRSRMQFPFAQDGASMASTDNTKK